MNEIKLPQPLELIDQQIELSRKGQPNRVHFRRIQDEPSRWIRASAYEVAAASYAEHEVLTGEEVCEIVCRLTMAPSGARLHLDRPHLK
jgi:hypothetical protein